jgi:hypothetical protein
VCNEQLELLDANAHVLQIVLGVQVAHDASGFRGELLHVERVLFRLGHLHLRVAPQDVPIAIGDDVTLHALVVLDALERLLHLGHASGSGGLARAAKKILRLLTGSVETSANVHVLFITRRSLLLDTRWRILKPKLSA